MTIVSIPFKAVASDAWPPDDARIVKAAVRFGDLVYTGWRHSNIIIYIHGLGKGYTTQDDQGFVDQHGNFYVRYTAGKVAARARQIYSMRHQTLLSEELWDGVGNPLNPTKPPPEPGYYR